MSDYSEQEFEYESEDEELGENEDAILIENTFYEADDCKRRDPAKALGLFKQVVQLEKDQPESNPESVVWKFKALQNIVILSSKLNDSGQGSPDTVKSVATAYEELLKSMKDVSRNDASEAINSILDTVTTGIDRLYELTLDALKASQNQRLYFTTSIKLAKLCLANRCLPKLKTVIDNIRSFEKSQGSSQEVEVMALEIQYYYLLGDYKSLQKIYPSCIQVLENSAIADPRNIAIIRECGGKGVHLRVGEWQKAYNELFDSFIHYQATGNGLKAKELLKYVVVSNMLSLSDINPFACREAKAYADDDEIVQLMGFRQSLEEKSIAKLDKYIILIEKDEFLKEYAGLLKREIRSQILLRIVSPYRKISLEYLQKELRVTSSELMALLRYLITSSKTLDATIDDVGGMLILESKTKIRKCILNRKSDVDEWILALDNLNTKLKPSTQMFRM